MGSLRDYKQTAAIVVTHNNHYIVGAVERLFTAGIRTVIVVVPSALDQGSTRDWLRNVRATDDERLLFVRDVDGNPDFSHLMDVGLKVAVNQHSGDLKYILSVAVETQITEQLVAEMHDDMETSEKNTPERPLGVVGARFEGVLNGNKVELGRTHAYPRTACSLYRYDAIRSNFRSGRYGGCEDFRFLLQLLAEADYGVRMSSEKVKIVVGQRHSVSTLRKRETQCIDAMLEEYEGSANVGGPERKAASLMRQLLGD